MRQPQLGDTPTHPATRRRLAQLRMVDQREASAGDIGTASRKGGALLK